MNLKYKTLTTSILALSLFALASTGQAQIERGAVAPSIGSGGNVIPAPMQIPYKVASELWGPAAKDVYAVQLTVSNMDADHQFQVNDIVASFDPEQCTQAESLYPQFNQADCRARFAKYFGGLPTGYSTLTQPQMLGIKSVRDLGTGRAKFFRATSFLITIASALTPYSIIGRDGKTALALFAGVGAPAIGSLIPDPAPGQTQRLADMSYNGHVVIGPNQAATFVIFIPNDLIFDKVSWELYKSDKGSAESLELKRTLQFFLTSIVTGAEIITSPPATFKSGLKAAKQ